MEGISGGGITEGVSESEIPEDEVPMDGVLEGIRPSLEGVPTEDLDGALSMSGNVSTSGVLEDATDVGRNLSSDAPESEDADVGEVLEDVGVMEGASENAGVGPMEGALETDGASMDTGVGGGPQEGAPEDARGGEEGSAAIPEPEEVVNEEDLMTTPPWWEELVIWCEGNDRSEGLIECVNTEFAHDPDLSSLPSGW